MANCKFSINSENSNKEYLHNRSRTRFYIKCFSIYVISLFSTILIASNTINAAGKIKMIISRQLLPIILVLCICNSTNAETFNFLKSRTEISKAVTIEKIFYAEDSNNCSFKVIRENFPDKFKEYYSEKLKKGKVYWLKLSLKNSSHTRQDVYLIFNRLISTIELYQHKKDSGYIQRIGGVLVPESQRSAKGYKKDKIPVSLEKDEVTQIYIRIYSDLEKDYDLSQISLINIRDFEKIAYEQNFLQGMFQGILFILIVINLFLFFYSRNKLYLYYFLYIFFTSIFLLQFYQYTEKILFFNYPLIDLWVYKSLVLNEFFFVLFFRQVMKDEEIGIWSKFIDYYLWGSGIIAIAIFIVATIDFYSSFVLIDSLAMINAVVGVFLFFVLFKKVRRSVKLILIGSMLMFIGGFISTYNDYSKTVAPHLYWYQLGIILELVFFTIAINHIFNEERLSKIQILYQNSLLEIERMQKEKENRDLKNTVDQNSRDLANKTLILFQNEKLITEIIRKLTELVHLRTKKNEGIREVISSLELSRNINIWDEFEIHFNNIHPDFYRRLVISYPELTANDKRLCAFLKMNFSSKEICYITGQSLNSIDVARSRMRRRMNLPRNQNLSSVLDNMN